MDFEEASKVVSRSKATLSRSIRYVYKRTKTKPAPMKIGNLELHPRALKDPVSHEEHALLEENA